jgi:hypothetical protein
MVKKTVSSYFIEYVEDKGLGRQSTGCPPHNIN